MSQPGGISPDQVSERLHLGQLQVQLNHAALTLALHQTGGAELQGLELSEMVLDRLELEGKAAAPGLAFRQRLHLLGGHRRRGTDGAEHEKPVRDLS